MPTVVGRTLLCETCLTRQSGSEGQHAKEAARQAADGVRRVQPPLSREGRPRPNEPCMAGVAAVLFGPKAHSQSALELRLGLQHLLPTVETDYGDHAETWPEIKDQCYLGTPI